MTDRGSGYRIEVLKYDSDFLRLLGSGDTSV